MAKKAMAGSRFSKPTINWLEFQKLVNPEEKTKYLSFKAKSESYLRRVLANPETPPQINWDEYKKIVPDASVVDKMKSAYEAYTVPYPADQLSAEVDKEWEALAPKIKTYCEEQKHVISVAKKELDRINALPPLDMITLEMFHDLYPDQALKPVEKPTFWPHSEEEQLGYVDPTAEKH